MERGNDWMGRTWGGLSALPLNKLQGEYFPGLLVFLLLLFRLGETCHRGKVREFRMCSVWVFLIRKGGGIIKKWRSS